MLTLTNCSCKRIQYVSISQNGTHEVAFENAAVSIVNPIPAANIIEVAEGKYDYDTPMLHFLDTHGAVTSCLLQTDSSLSCGSVATTQPTPFAGIFSSIAIGSLHDLWAVDAFGGLWNNVTSHWNPIGDHTQISAGNRVVDVSSMTELKLYISLPMKLTIFTFL